MHDQTRRTAIPRKVKEAVARRDSIDGRCCCILCGSPDAAPNAHIVRRSQGGMGVEQNIVSLCLRCHEALDEGKDRERLMERVEAYIKGFYPDWTPESVTYRKWGSHA